MKKDRISLEFLEKDIKNKNVHKLPIDQKYKCPGCKKWIKQVFAIYHFAIPHYSGLLICGSCGKRSAAIEFVSKKYAIALNNMLRN